MSALAPTRPAARLTHDDGTLSEFYGEVIAQPDPDSNLGHVHLEVSGDICYGLPGPHTTSYGVPDTMPGVIEPAERTGAEPDVEATRSYAHDHGDQPPKCAMRIDTITLVRPFQTLGQRCHRGRV